MDRDSTVLEHLDELRRRAITALVALGIATVASVPFSSFLLKILRSPAEGVIEKLAFFSPEEAFLVYMRISLLAGLIISFPAIAYQIWAFVAPAIDAKFKRYAAYFISATSVAFVAGCLFSYLVLLPAALKFLLGIGSGELEPVISAGRYISFVSGFLLACGLTFQMPVLSFFLTKVGAISPAFLRKNFKFAVLAIFILAAVITPTGDAFNMLALALPMLLLYEVSVWVSALTKGKKV